MCLVRKFYAATELGAAVAHGTREERTGAPAPVKSGLQREGKRCIRASHLLRIASGVARAQPLERMLHDALLVMHEVRRVGLDAADRIQDSSIDLPRPGEVRSLERGTQLRQERGGATVGEHPRDDGGGREEISSPPDRGLRMQAPVAL